MKLWANSTHKYAPCLNQHRRENPQGMPFLRKEVCVSWFSRRYLAKDGPVSPVFCRSFDSSWRQLQVARIEWSIFQDWIPLDQQCTRTHKHLEWLQHLVDHDDLGSTHCCRGGFAISDTQNDRSSRSVSVRLMVLLVIQNVEDDMPSCLHLNWPIRFRSLCLNVGVHNPTCKVSRLPLSLGGGDAELPVKLFTHWG